MKLLQVMCIFILSIFYIKCTQHLYEFVPDHCLVKTVNPLIGNFNQSKCFKLNRTQLYLNMSFDLHVDILSDSMGQIKVVGYQFRSNEYRKGPIDFMLGICSSLGSKNFDIPNMFAHTNLKCPLRKGHHYYANNISPNASNMPPLIPEGKWMLEITYLYMNKYVIATVEWYSAVVYPVKFH